MRAAVNLSSGIYFMLLAASSVYIISLRATRGPPRAATAAPNRPIRLVDIFYKPHSQSGDRCSLSVRIKGSLKWFKGDLVYN